MNEIKEWIDAYSKVMNQIEKLCEELNDNVAARLLFNDTNIFSRISQDIDLSFQIGMILVSLSSASYSKCQLMILKSFTYADYMTYFGQDISWDELWNAITQVDSQELLDNFITNAKADGVFIRLAQLICLGQSLVPNYSATMFMQFSTLFLIYNNAGKGSGEGVESSQNYMNTLWESAYRRMEESGVDPGLKIHFGSDNE